MHIPKTAGMALRSFLGNQYAVSGIMPAAGWTEMLSLDVDGIAQYRLFQGHFSCGLFDLLPPDARPVVFLREPVARTISHLKHMRRDPEFHPAHKIAAGRSLDELVRDDRIMRLCCNIQVAQLSNDIPAGTILAGLRREREEGRVPNPDAYALEPDPAKAARMLARFHYVGFVESFQEDILQMSAALGLHPPRMVAKRNDDPEGETDISTLHPETLAVLRERNALDIAFYDAARRRPRLAWHAVAAGLLDPAPYAPITQPIDFPMSGAIPGSNWYPCEKDAAGVFRWAGPYNETMLDLPLAPGYRFEVSLTVVLRNLDDLSVHAGADALPLHCHGSEGAKHRISFWVPAEAVSAVGLTSLCFRTKEVFRASDSDVRMLSFLVSDLRISRVERAARRRGQARRPSAGVEADAGEKPAVAGGQARSAPAAERAGDSLRLDPRSRVEVLGEPVGFFPDGWVRAYAVLRCRALESIGSVLLQIWAPPGDEALTVTVHAPGQPDRTVTAPREVVATVEYALHAEPGEEFAVELLAGDERQLSEIDRRRASYILRGISFL